MEAPACSDVASISYVEPGKLDATQLSQVHSRGKVASSILHSNLITWHAFELRLFCPYLQDLNAFPPSGLCHRDNPVMLMKVDSSPMFENVKELAAQRGKRYVLSIEVIHSLPTKTLPRRTLTSLTL